MLHRKRSGKVKVEEKQDPTSGCRPEIQSDPRAIGTPTCPLRCDSGGDGVAAEPSPADERSAARGTTPRTHLSWCCGRTGLACRKGEPSGKCSSRGERSPKHRDYSSHQSEGERKVFPTSKHLFESAESFLAALRETCEVKI